MLRITPFVKRFKSAIFEWKLEDTLREIAWAEICAKQLSIVKEIEKELAEL